MIKRCSSGELTPSIEANVEACSTITTDGWQGDHTLASQNYKHRQMLQCKTDEKDSVLPDVHLIISLIKRLMLGTFQGCYDKKYLQRCLDKYLFRFNRRITTVVGERFWRIANKLSLQNPLPTN